jgi:signal transduction histidine kinase
MTATAMSVPSRSALPEERRGVLRSYGRYWRRMPRELGYLAVTAVIGFLSLTLFRAAESIGAGLLAILVGLIVFALLLVASRYLGAFELYRLRLARLPVIAPPTWTPPFAGKRFFRALGDVVGNPHYWLYYLHSGVLNPILAILTSALWLTWIPLSLGLTATAAWGFLPSGGQQVALRGLPVGGAGWTNAEVAFAAISGRHDALGAILLTSAATALGILMIATFPFVTRGLSMAHWGLGRLLLSRFRSEDLDVEVERVGVAQRAAVAAEDNALRRLERDIHDGPQQRLLRLQMELASAERHLGTDSTATAESLAEARAMAQEALDELRALAQGFAPPLLQDRGLQAALEALARRSAVPIDAQIALERQVPSPIERSAYFVAAELTSNAIKHAAARRITMRVTTQPPAATGGPGSLVLTVSDDGVGGASVLPHHGLAGAAERLAGLGGSLVVSSPTGGPTQVTATIPLPDEH